MTRIAKVDETLYPAILGSDWERLSFGVRQAHEMSPCCGSGFFDIAHSDRLLARIITRCARLPAAGTAVTTTLSVTRVGRREMWTRMFGMRRLWSTQYSPGSDLLVEQLGLLEICFQLEVERGGIHYCQQRAFIRIAGYRLPLPRWISPRVDAVELPGIGVNQISVSVAVHLPISGLLMHYEGYIELREGTA